MALSKKLRIPSADFKNINKRAKRIYWNWLSLKVASNNYPNPRFGIVIPNKISKKATVRNKIKRQIHAALASEFENKLGNFDVIIILKSGEIRTQEEIKKALNDVFKKAGVL